MRKEDHRKIAQQLARALGLSEQEEWAILGSDLPDLDLFIGKHRETFHNIGLTSIAGVIPNEKARTAFLLGIGSHLMADKFSKQINAFESIVSLVRRISEL